MNKVNFSISCPTSPLEILFDLPQIGDVHACCKDVQHRTSMLIARWKNWKTVPRQNKIRAQDIAFKEDIIQ